MKLQHHVRGDTRCNSFRYTLSLLLNTALCGMLHYTSTVITGCVCFPHVQSCYASRLGGGSSPYISSPHLVRHPCPTLVDWCATYSRRVSLRQYGLETLLACVGRPASACACTPHLGHLQQAEATACWRWPLRQYWCGLETLPACVGSLGAYSSSVSLCSSTASRPSRACLCSDTGA